MTQTHPAAAGPARRHRVPAGRSALHRAGDLVGVLPLLLRLVGVCWLLVLAGLLGCAGISRVIGWQPAVVVGGSMRPAIRPGDIVVADPAAGPLRPGQIVLLHDRDRGGALLTHRIARALPDGELVTKGDANPAEDTSPRARSDIVGMVRLVVPQAGRAVMLAHQPSPADVAWVLCSLAAAVAVVAIRPPSGRPGRRARGRPGRAT